MWSLFLMTETTRVIRSIWVRTSLPHDVLNSISEGIGLFGCEDDTVLFMDMSHNPQIFCCAHYGLRKFRVLEASAMLESEPHLLSMRRSEAISLAI